LKTDELGDDDMMAFLKEISIMSSLKHENILKFKGACLVDVICLVTEYAHKGDLRSYLQKNIVDTSRKLDFALQIAKAMVSNPCSNYTQY
jgi:serine/threonine protein kinase